MIARERTWGNFLLLERSPVLIDGAPGEQIKFSYLPFRVFADDDIALFRIRTYTEFYRGGYSWSISLSCPAAMEEQGLADYMHIRDSFRFLD